ncbi:hypothetical protein ACFQVB_39335 [Paraburkholderia humisilvae]|uniref:Uncharacterized protein n=1 Tax=Paraburkholderia humisilvae TaxID=627669 RepID=A0A6J5F6E7_9BURK|nr:hypothetical protein LMG29542_07755 [Paraburkholderia humisilvae]
MRLAGDKVFGYINLLGILAALMSRELIDIDSTLYDPLTRILENHPEQFGKLGGLALNSSVYCRFGASFSDIQTSVQTET